MFTWLHDLRKHTSLGQALKTPSFFLSLCLCIGLASSLHGANIYMPPQDLLDEARANKVYLEQHPTSANAYFELAMSYAYTGQIQKGWDTLQQIPKYDDNFAPVVFNTYNPLIEKDPNNWKYHFKIAFAYYFMKEKEKAIDSFERVLTIDPKHIWAMGFISLIRGELDQVDDAIAIAKQALSIEPQATAIHFLLAEGYRRKGKYMLTARHTLKVGQLLLAEKQSGIYDD